VERESIKYNSDCMVCGTGTTGYYIFARSDLIRRKLLLHVLKRFIVHSVSEGPYKIHDASTR